MSLQGLDCLSLVVQVLSKVVLHLPVPHTPKLRDSDERVWGRLLITNRFPHQYNDFPQL